MIDQGYKKLDIYVKAHELAVRVHQSSLSFPKHEMYEEGSQIRRSSKSISSNIVEGYCLRKHKNEFLLYLNRAYASCSETIEHLEILFDTKSLTDKEVYNDLRNQYEVLSKMLFSFAQTVAREHGTPYTFKEPDFPYITDNPSEPNL